MATRYVRYVGAAHRRVITSADWRSAKVKADQVIWEAQNGFAVPLDQFSDAQLKAIESDPHLIVTGEEDDWEPVSRLVDMTPRELQHALENPVDLVAVLNGDAEAPAGLSGPSTGLVPGGNVRTDDQGPVATLDEADEDSASR